MCKPNKFKIGRKKVEMPVISGIYKIMYRGRIYIGSSTNIHMRFAYHRSKLKNGKHTSRELQKEYSTYGGNLKMKIIIECPYDLLVHTEYTIIRNCEKRGVKLWNMRGINSIESKYYPDIEYVYRFFS